jgi:hypothetical protein
MLSVEDSKSIVKHEYGKNISIQIIVDYSLK